MLAEVGRGGGRQDAAASTIEASAHSVATVSEPFMRGPFVRPAPWR
jgi:hypothetical protein